MQNCFLLSFILFSFLSCLPPWRNKAAGLPVNTGCNYGQQCRGAINICGSLCKAQECSLKMGRLMKWDVPEETDAFCFSRCLHHIFHSVKEWVAQTLHFDCFFCLWFQSSCICVLKSECGSRNLWMQWNIWMIVLPWDWELKFLEAVNV